ncbi:hypothetical protein [Photorhabdus bodei]|uniref:Integrase n=1 Tax=Photorhabdus bodei TaxID=2029681 RepID=A0AAW6BK99_9GAMM|nr:hypothetical protein [Photorhabdus bodei]MDB6373933.1 hypothetical protein [Photorhabdus bodei]
MPEPVISYNRNRITQITTRLLMLTSLRTIEIRAAEWREIDYDKCMVLRSPPCAVIQSGKSLTAEIAGNY